MAEEVTALGLVEDVRQLLATGEWQKAVALTASLHPADLAELVLELDEDERRALLEHLPSDLVGQLFEHYETDEDIDALIRAVGIERLPTVLADVADDVAADVIQRLEPDDQITVLARLDREEVTELLRYAENSVGGIMSRGFVALNEGITVQQAIDYLRVLRPPADRVYYVYVVDGQGKLVGAVSIRDLIVASPRTKLSEIARRDVHALTTDVDQEEAARTLQRYDLLALPVVDEEGKLVGVITVDDVIDVLQEEATEDMYRLAGLSEHESVLAPVGRSIRRRMPWLLVNLVTAFAAALTVAPFEDTISRAALLAAFMPIIAGHSGNTGTQVVTLVVRGLAVGEVRVSDLLTIVRKELAFGFVHGLVAGGVTALLAFILSFNPWMAMVVWAALLGNVIIAGLAGALIPLGLRRLGVDPAVASAIWLTTFTDIIGFLMLLGLGTLLLDRLS